MITTIREFKKEYKKGIIVNYDTRTVIRTSTPRIENIADSVDYPYIQAYQKGVKPTTTLFMIRNGIIKKLVRVNNADPNSRYRKIDVSNLISNDICKDQEFYKEGERPHIIYEGLLKIEE